MASEAAIKNNSVINGIRLEPAHLWDILLDGLVFRHEFARPDSEWAHREGAESGMTSPITELDAAALHGCIASHRDSIRADWISQIRGIQELAKLDRRVVDDACLRVVDHLITMLGVRSASPVAASALSEPLRDLLSSLSVNFAERGLTPSQTAGFILSLKPVLADLLQTDFKSVMTISQLVDTMGLFTIEMFMQRREHIIRRQAQELIDVSVPVVPLWEGILSMPIIGTLDSGRAMAITEKLLLEIERTGSRHAVLDISGVPTVDTQTAQHLAKTVAAARLMGAECVVTGIRPAIAQVMVSLGIDLSTVATRFSLAEGLRLCFSRLGLQVGRQAA